MKMIVFVFELGEPLHFLIWELILVRLSTADFSASFATNLIIGAPRAVTTGNQRQIIVALPFSLVLTYFQFFQGHDISPSRDCTIFELEDGSLLPGHPRLGGLHPFIEERLPNRAAAVIFLEERRLFNLTMAFSAWPLHAPILTTDSLDMVEEGFKVTD